MISLTSEITDEVSFGWWDHHLHLCHRWSKHDNVPCLRAQAGNEPTFSEWQSDALAAGLTRHQSIIYQLSISPISPAKPGSVTSQPNQCSIAKLMKQLHCINVLLGVLVSTGERPSQRDVPSDVSKLYQCMYQPWVASTSFHVYVHQYVPVCGMIPLSHQLLCTLLDLLEWMDVTLHVELPDHLYIFWMWSA